MMCFHATFCDGFAPLIGYCLNVSQEYLVCAKKACCTRAGYSHQKGSLPNTIWMEPGELLFVFQLISPYSLPPIIREQVLRYIDHPRSCAYAPTVLH
jgi:hypothetical protein